VVIASAFVLGGVCLAAWGLLRLLRSGSKKNLSGRDARTEGVWDQQLDEPDTDPRLRDDPYTGFRRLALSFDRNKIRITQSPEDGPVWGLIMDIAFPNEGAFTLVAFLDGTCSLYFSSGGAIVGGGGHESVRHAVAAFLATANQLHGNLKPVSDSPLPTKGRVAFYGRTDSGLLWAEAGEEELSAGRHPLSSLYVAGHVVIAQLRKHSKTERQDTPSARGEVAAVEPATDPRNEKRSLPFDRIRQVIGAPLAPNSTVVLVSAETFRSFEIYRGSSIPFDDRSYIVYGTTILACGVRVPTRFEIDTKKPTLLAGPGIWHVDGVWYYPFSAEALDRLGVSPEATKPFSWTSNVPIETVEEPPYLEDQVLHRRGAETESRLD
jgi:hypothetical protein